MNIELAASPEQVWAVVMDPQRFGEWVTIHRKIESCSPLPLRVGSRIRQQLAIAGVPFRVNWEITELKECELAVWRGAGPARSHATTIYRLSQTPGGTHFSYESEFKAPGGPLGAVAGRVLVGGISESEAKKTLARLKALLEASD